MMATLFFFFFFPIPFFLMDGYVLFHVSGASWGSFQIFGEGCSVNEITKAPSPNLLPVWKSSVNLPGIYTILFYKKKIYVHQTFTSTIFFGTHFNLSLLRYLIIYPKASVLMFDINFVSNKFNTLLLKHLGSVGFSFLERI